MRFISISALAAMLAHCAMSMPSAKADESIIVTREVPGQGFSTKIPNPRITETFDLDFNAGCKSSFAIPGFRRSFVTSANIPGVTLNPTNSCYYSIPSNGSTLLNVVALDNLFREFGFFWGSIDPSNRVEFMIGGSELVTITGSDIINAFGMSDVFVNFFLPQSVFFDAVRFSTGITPFEFDNVTLGLSASLSQPPRSADGTDTFYIPGPTIPRFPTSRGPLPLSAGFNIEPVSFDLDAQATPVSEPASLALFGAGLGLFGLMAGRRKPTKVA